MSDNVALGVQVSPLEKAILELERISNLARVGSRCVEGCAVGDAALAAQFDTISDSADKLLVDLEALATQ